MATNPQENVSKRENTFTSGQKGRDSHFWSCLMEVKDLVLLRGMFKVHGTQARF
jgi:hypothetical protein